MGGSSNELYAFAPREQVATDGIAKELAALREELKYMQASNVNVSSFVSVKLCGHSNYAIWRDQMLYLIDSQMLRDIIYNVDRRYVDRYDKLVIGWIYGSMNEKLLNKFVGSACFNNFARDVWRQLDSSYNSSLTADDEIHEEDASTDVVELGFKFGKELSKEALETEITDDNMRRRRLYKAAIEGCWWKAKSILKNAASKLEPIAENGNTILHIAVEMGHNYFVEQLLEFLTAREDILLEAVNDKGRTALHIAAVVGNINAARLLIQKRKQLLVIRDAKEKTPWDISFNITNLDVYTFLLKSMLSSGLTDLITVEGVWNPLNAAIVSNQYNLAQTILKQNLITSELSLNVALTILTLTFPASLGFAEAFIYPSLNTNGRLKTVVKRSLLFDYNFLDKCVDDIKRVEKICINACCKWLGKHSMILVVPIATLYSIYQLICLLILVLHLTLSMFYFHLWKALAVTGLPPIKNIEEKKKKYEQARELLSLICDHIDKFKGGCKITKTPMILAIREGAYEVIDEILFRSPERIMCKNEEGHNVIQLAIISRSEKLYNLIRHIVKGVEVYRTLKDSNGNSLAHLAGRLAPSIALARTTGAALQLQRELIWHNEVKTLMSPTELITMNHDKETPAMVFTREHKELMKEGEEWMKTTAESCSITAALIVTVVFAAAITVPGGNEQETGIPMLKKESAFTVFAVSNAFSLFTAAAALLMFLSILTARFSEKDFLVSLPRRLIFGLLGLFLSTTTMIVAFGAILYLVFCDHRPWMLAPIVLFSCLPISVIVMIKLPLLVDLIRSTYFPIFGNQTYLESCKIKRENTIFTDH
ncbi:hypothetical protein QVD17_03188 [Tagetes erecta]|uniref:PGG domain-containing protein n=1 Tax=Tagetes erecta TaxID=13708 RepID=A0AAD8LF99_TARER|nr:hypothetical protein QVD17_03188 [Tagetes erecta]